ncbi:MAG: AtpZ/AtpI family protein [Candidatus Terrybacteria bacterium]|nr:AtpZ/AtpI family protein [Candidatus Terrybacteria bacterium]
MNKLESKTPAGMREAVGLAWQLGYATALPIVGFVLVGKLADQLFDTAPWLLFSGLIVSLPVTFLILYRKVKKFL